MIDDFEQIILSKMKDIRGLEDVSMFPLAAGWWIIIALVGLFFLFYLIKKFNEYRYRRTWRFEAIKKLDMIDTHLNETNHKQSVSEITEIIKRVAIQRHGRKEVSALSGNDWISWLQIRNPKNLNWEKYKELLINYPYMQEYKFVLKEKEIRDLIKTVKNWI